MRIVAVDNASPALGVDGFALDNRRAADLAVSHLLALRHRRIGVVAGIPHQHVSRERLAGYREALGRRGMEAPPELVGHGNFRIEDAYETCRRLLRVAPRPTALFVANNLMLIGVMRALADEGVSVPGEMSVCSIDDFPWAPAFQPALTVVRQPIAAMASAAFRRLAERLGGDEGAVGEYLFAPELVVRRSCAPLATS